MKAMHRVRIAAERSGWTLKAQKGQRHDYAGGGFYDRDIFVIGEVHRHLADGTPVVEPAHQIDVDYRADGAIRWARGISYTPEKVIYHDGISSSIKEKNKAARVAMAFIRKDAEILPE